MTIHIIGAGIAGLSTGLALAREGHRVAIHEARTGAAQGASFAPGGLVGTLPPAFWPPASGWSGRLGGQSAGFPAMTVPILGLQARRWARARRASHEQAQAGLAATRTPQPETGEPRPMEEDATRRLARAPASPGAPGPEPRGPDHPDHPDRPDAPRAADTAASPDPAPSPFELMAASLRLDHERGQGHLVVARDQAQARHLQRWLADLRAGTRRPGQGPLPAWLDGEQLRAAEPGLNRDTTAAGALSLPGDEVGNCRQMAMAMRAEAARLGVVFRFGTAVARIEPAPQRGGWRLHLASGQAIDAPRLVLCASDPADALLRPLGFRPPLQPAHAYTLTVPVREPLNAPRHAALTDAGSQVSIARQGQRIRVSGGYRLGPQPRRHSAAAIRGLYDGLARWFPGAAVLGGNALVWSSTVWIAADDQPLVGPAPGLPGLWLNIGHGFQGWANSLEAAQSLADQLRGERGGEPGA